MNESSNVPARFEFIIIIPSGVMNFKSRKLCKKIYTYIFKMCSTAIITCFHLTKNYFSVTFFDSSISLWRAIVRSNICYSQLGIGSWP
jgi:hypothetical protein